MSSVKITLALLRIFVFLCVSLKVLAQDNTIIIVDVPELGKIQGNQAFTSRDQRPYWVFHGIPYADPTSYTGCKRFQPSEVHTGPLTEDGSIFLANRLFVICPQNAIFDLPEESAQDLLSVLTASSKSKKIIMKSIHESKSIEQAKDEIPQHWGQEDCLTININTPMIPTTSENQQLLPVILFFHGGGSDSIWGSAFTGLRLMEKNVLLLTINYRLGALGAFNLGIDEAPGCGALYDAVTALKWIQRYIQYFGGDPNKITITGQSAGAMMVTHLLLSPLAKGLFHRVWGFSGSALNVWGTSINPSIKHHLDVAHYAGCYNRETTPIPNANLKSIAECMAGKDIQEIIIASNLYEVQETSAGRLGYDGKGPASIQSHSLTHPKFLVEDPIEILRQKKQNPVPLVLGATKHDGSFPLDDIYNKYLLPSGQLTNATYVQNVMLTELMKTFGVEDNTGGLYHSMAHSYLGDAANTPDFDTKIPGLIDIATVFGYKGGQYKMIEYHAKIQPKSYFYSFDYKGRWTLYNILFGLDKKIPGGICHTDDMMYIFYLLPLFNDDMKVSRRLVDYFVNFATYGDPNGLSSDVNLGKVVWPNYNDDEHTFLVMNRTDRIGYQCPDTWVGASLELITSKNKIPNEEIDDILSSWQVNGHTLNSGKKGRTDWGLGSNSAGFKNIVCQSTGHTDETTAHVTEWTGTVGTDETTVHVTHFTDTIGTDETTVHVTHFTDTIGTDETTVHVTHFTDTVGTDETTVHVTHFTDTVGTDETTVHVTHFTGTVGTDETTVHVTHFTDTVGTDDTTFYPTSPTDNGNNGISITMSSSITVISILLIGVLIG